MPVKSKTVSMLKLCEGKEPAIVFINGFLQENDTSFDEWKEAISVQFAGHACYGLAWPSNDMWTILAEAQKRAKLPSYTPLKKMAKISNTFTFAWKDALNHTHTAGDALAKWLSKRDTPVILMGHSLGARIIHRSLITLKKKYGVTKPKSKVYLVQDIYLLGGAITSELKEWQKIEDTFSGTLYNIYSDNDNALKRVYFMLTRGEEAIGISEIECIEDSFFTNIPLPEKIKSYFKNKLSENEEKELSLDLRIVNFDASQYVAGHTKYKLEYNKILSALHNSAE